VKPFDARPLYVWKRTANDVVSVAQMQSNRERDDKLLTKQRIPAVKVHADLIEALGNSR
jgi:hypothetical protein